MIGRSIRHYTIVEKIGEGGMGEVYRATDTRLKREVALKILPESFAADPQRMARFQREAEVLASLNHPNIAAIHGLEEDHGVHAIAMELVEGETLAARIHRGALPLEEALRIALQITQALEAAHEKGIIHRDLKPANVIVTPAGKVKVLDFGLAKPMEATPSRDASHSPTLTLRATQAGMILGTAAYMAPEQARGQAVDQRVDIWAFGCVLYEMLTGRKTFEGETATDILGAAIYKEPDWEALPRSMPWGLRSLLGRCLAKSADSRLHDVSDARIEIEAVQKDPTAGTGFAQAPGVAPAPVWRQVLPWIITAVVTLAATLVIWNPFEPSPEQPGVVRSAILLPEKLRLAGKSPAEGGTLETYPVAGFNRPSRRSIALSPDGRLLVFSATTGDQTPQLYRRPLDQLQAAPIPGTEGGIHPFFSPDGQWIAFFTGGFPASLNKIRLEGGLPVEVVAANQTYPSGSWGADGKLVFVRQRTIWQVSQTGEQPQQLTRLEEGEVFHISPELLPNGKALLLAVYPAGKPFGETNISLQNLESGSRITLLELGSEPHYVPTGHLIFAREGTLFAAPFDLDRLVLTGTPAPVVDDIMQALYSGYQGFNTSEAQVSLSQTGTLAYVPGGVYPEPRFSLVVVDQRGQAEPVSGAPSEGLIAPRFSPDGQQIAWATFYAGSQRSLRILDTSTGVVRHLIIDGAASNPIWTPDGQRIVFGLRDVEEPGIYWVPADQSAPVEKLLVTEPTASPHCWTPDGKKLVFAARGDLWTLSIDDRKVDQITNTPYPEDNPDVSPDGRYLAYVSFETGPTVVWVQSFPGPGERRQISPGPGGSPSWSPDGRHLFYTNVETNGEEMLVVDVQTSPRFSAGKPRSLFKGDYVEGINHRFYDLTPDGKKFLMVQYSESQPPPPPIIIVQNWFQDLKARSN